MGRVLFKKGAYMSSGKPDQSRWCSSKEDGAWCITISWSQTDCTSSMIWVLKVPDVPGQPGKINCGSESVLLDPILQLAHQRSEV